MRPAIDSFRDTCAFLSNFTPATVKYGPYLFPTTEHAYQFAKIPKDKITSAVAEKLAGKTAAQAKAFGKELGTKNLLREDWESIKVPVMRFLLTQKFEIPEFREALLRTGDVELIEGNLHHDNEWGDCHCTTAKPDARKYGQRQKCHMRGKNLLGQLLMELRAELFVRHPHRCPECGSSENLAQKDLVPGLAAGHFDNGVFVFDGDTKMDWNGQHPECSPPEYFCSLCSRTFSVPLPSPAPLVGV